MCLLSLGLCAQTDPMKYARLYADCVDDEPSTIYGGSYSEYPKNFQDAQFPGGDVELSLFIYHNTEMQEVYSGEVDAGGTKLLVTGEVLVEFVVDRCGKPGQFRIVQSLTDEQDAEAMRVMESLPIFNPATLDGYRVKSAYVAPIKFSHERWRVKEESLSYDDYDYNYSSDDSYNYDDNSYNYDDSSYNYDDNSYNYSDNYNSDSSDEANYYYDENGNYVQRKDSTSNNNNSSDSYDYHQSY